MTDTAVTTRNPYLDEYQALLDHQKEHTPVITNALGQPDEYCYECVRKSPGWPGRSSMRQKWSWGVPNEAALNTIIRYSPNGLIEIGAGAGYWCSLLRERGLDVVAYDINPPPGSSWTSRETPYTEITQGDHTNVAGFKDRTLLTCWPERTDPWPHEMVTLYEGDTIIYIGEGPKGCTGTREMLQLLGIEESDAPLFKVTETVDIPQWSGMRDRMYACRRI